MGSPQAPARVPSGIHFVNVPIGSPADWSCPCGFFFCTRAGAEDGRAGLRTRIGTGWRIAGAGPFAHRSTRAQPRGCYTFGHVNNSEAPTSPQK